MGFIIIILSFIISNTSFIIIILYYNTFYSSTYNVCSHHKLARQPTQPHLPELVLHRRGHQSCQVRGVQTTVRLITRVCSPIHPPHDRDQGLSRFLGLGCRVSPLFQGRAGHRLPEKTTSPPIPTFSHVPSVTPRLHHQLPRQLTCSRGLVDLLARSRQAGHEASSSALGEHGQLTSDWIQLLLRHRRRRPTIVVVAVWSRRLFQQPPHDRSHGLQLRGPLLPLLHARSPQLRHPLDRGLKLDGAAGPRRGRLRQGLLDWGGAPDTRSATVKRAASNSPAVLVISLASASKPRGLSLPFASSAPGTAFVFVR